ncbi:MAG: HD domain-containing protein [Spirochaetes bacterium]|nr:HD domain-containing protein [Spirochaetota bacterium]
MQHSLDVARSAYTLARFFSVDPSPCVRAALLHDFFHYNWRTRKFPKGQWHAFEHGKIALSNAERTFGPLSSAERDAIRHHMWPLSLVPPHHAAAWIVTLADKIVTARDIRHWLALRFGTLARQGEGIKALRAGYRRYRAKSPPPLA